MGCGASKQSLQQVRDVERRHSITEYHEHMDDWAERTLEQDAVCRGVRGRHGQGSRRLMRCRFRCRYSDVT